MILQNMREYAFPCTGADLEKQKYICMNSFMQTYVYVFVCLCAWLYGSVSVRVNSYAYRSAGGGGWGVGVGGVAK